MNFHFFLLYFVLVGVASAATINICVQKKKEGITATVSGASVKCYDEDVADANDPMTTTNKTGSDGCVILTYKKKTPKWYNPCAGWDCTPYQNPDIYCRVTNSTLFTLYTDTKDGWIQDKTANFGIVTMYPDRSGDQGNTSGCGQSSLWQGINGVASFLPGFKKECNNHDLCYSNCNETQRNCDREFRYLMYSKCNKDWETFSSTAVCKAVANGMYSLVKTFGWDCYITAQKEWCIAN